MTAMTAIDDLALDFARGPTYKTESHLPAAFGGPYDWHVIEGRWTLKPRPKVQA